uniref:Uncharacterized protein n=1 Tax=Plectus sambesii TaxID=2011161 RepID=A0A914UMB8_9BILA
MEATGTPADEAIRKTQQIIDKTLDEVEKMLLRLPLRRFIPTNSVDARTVESSATTTVVSPDITTANLAQLPTAHSPEVNITEQQRLQSAVTAVVPVTTSTQSSAIIPAPSSEAIFTNQKSQAIFTADLPATAMAMSVAANLTDEQHNRSTSPSITTAVTPKAKTAVSPMNNMARSTFQQRSFSTSMSTRKAASPTERTVSSPVNRLPTSPSSVPLIKPHSFVLPRPRTSTPFHGQLMQSLSSPAIHLTFSPMDETAHSPTTPTAGSPTVKTTGSSTKMADTINAFVLQGPVTVTSHENVSKREDGLVYVNELIELRGAGVAGMPDKELQPRNYSHMNPTSAEGSVNSTETIKVGNNAVRIQRAIAVNPAGPLSTKLSEFALSELRIYPQDGIAPESPSTSDILFQPARMGSEKDNGGVDIKLNINLQSNNGTSTTPTRIKCDGPGFVPTKVWVNDRLVWTTIAD